MPEPHPTSLDHAVLGLLAQRPASGYDILVQFGNTPLIRFSPSPGSVYPSLKRLRRWRLAVGKGDRSNRLRRREVFRITPRGKRRLREWLFAQITREEVAMRPDELNLKFALMQAVGSPEDAIRFLEDYRCNMRDYRCELMRLHQQRGNAMGSHWRLSLELGIRRYRQNADWAEYAIAAIRPDKSAKVARATGRSPLNARPAQTRRQRRSSSAG